ncbi:2OG-Fe dioxygenase family protein [Lonsdalea quercina]|uniref:2OG-Fe dioxygenase family protein n=1 Tax=Lonsdalea quercina TaxID=71657 RepID=UPI0039765C82
MNYEKKLHQNGYALIPGAWYESLYIKDPYINESIDEETKQIIQHYEKLVLDPYSPGSRFSAYSQCQTNDYDNLTLGHFEPYFQTKNYNPDTGGIVRSYPLIPSDIVENKLFRLLIIDDIRFVKKYGEIGDPSKTIIGIHLFRYLATPDAPAFSSPVWLHRDDEDIVFVHLLSLSENAMGGDNIIATDGRHLERVMRLEKPLDTLVVNHAKLHAVTPIWCKETAKKETQCTRDIILVTFQRRK